MLLPDPHACLLPLCKEEKNSPKPQLLNRSHFSLGSLYSQYAGGLQI